MGQVAMKLQIMPDSIERDMSELKKEVKKALRDHDVRGIAERPIAFGLSALEIVLVLPDSAGSEAIENAILSVDGVQSVNVISIDLL